MLVKWQGILAPAVEQGVGLATGVADCYHVIVQGQVAQMLENSEVIAREREFLDMLGV